MSLKYFFFNDLNRVRSGWRMIVFMLSWFLASLVVLVPLVVILQNLPIGFTDRSLTAYLVQFTALFAVAVLFGWLYGKIFEDLPFRALGAWFTRGWFKDLILGFVFGGVTLALAALTAFALGSMTFQMNPAHGTAAILVTLGSTFLIFTAGALYEEAFFRGYMLQTFARARLAVFGLLLTSLLFASFHNQNPSANYFSFFNTLLAGVWLGAAYFKTRNLWFPFGVHFAWNWFQGSIFGITVSGLEELAPAPLMKATDLGPTWLTGGQYGLEGGAICTFALVVSTLVIWFTPFLKADEELLAMTSEEISKARN